MGDSLGDSRADSHELGVQGNEAGLCDKLADLGVFSGHEDSRRRGAAMAEATVGQILL